MEDQRGRTAVVVEERDVPPNVMKLIDELCKRKNPRYKLDILTQSKKSIQYI